MRSLVEKHPPKVSWRERLRKIGSQTGITTSKTFLGAHQTSVMRMRKSHQS